MVWLSSLRSKDVNATTCCHILCVMGDIAVHLNEETKERVVGRLSKGTDGGRLLREMMWLSLSHRLSAADLMSWLKTFTLPLEVISSAVETLYQFGCSDDIKQTQVREIYPSAADLRYEQWNHFFSNSCWSPFCLDDDQTQEQCNLVSSSRKQRQNSCPAQRLMWLKPTVSVSCVFVRLFWTSAVVSWCLPARRICPA